MSARSHFWISVIYCAIFLIFLFFIFSSKISAAIELKIEEIKGNPSQINYDQEIEIITSLTGCSGVKEYFLQALFTFSSGSPRYFGFTQGTDGNWYSYGEDYSNFFKIETSEEGSWSGILKAKPDRDAEGFKGSGGYTLKLTRYVKSNNKNWSINTLTLDIQAPPSPSPSPSPFPSPSSPSESDSSDSSPSPSPTSQNSSILSAKASPKSTSTKKVTVSPSIPLPILSTESGEILGATQSATASSESEEESKSSIFVIPAIISGFGILLLTGATFPFWKPKILTILKR